MTVSSPPGAPEKCLLNRNIVTTRVNIGVFGDPNRNFSRASNFYVEDGAYFRVKTLQLGYTLPFELTSRVGIRKLRFYVSGNNLLTVTKYSGFDPEIGGNSFGVDRGIYPQPRFFLFGVNVGI